MSISLMVGKWAFGCIDRDLVEIGPKTAWKKEGESFEEVETDSLEPKDEILIKPGRRVPLDSQILEGEALMDESFLTGEALPVLKKRGDYVYAGTLVTEGLLVAQVVKHPDQSRLSHITHLVEETLARKPPIQRMADRASAYLVALTLLVSLLTFSILLLEGFDGGQAFLRTVAILVVVCPCSLGLATPLAIALSIGLVAHRGILVRNSASLERASQIQRVIFDKTGTLTLARLSVVDIQVLEESDSTPEEILQMAKGVEQFSQHPIALAIMSSSTKSAPMADHFQSIPGVGASAYLPEIKRSVFVGSDQLFLTRPEWLYGKSDPAMNKGETVIWVGWNERPFGFISLADSPNPQAEKALRMLKAKGISVEMLSGDNQKSTEVMARQLGIENFQGGLSPMQKALKVKEYQDQGETVAMVGDGINDAPALAQADVSITVSTGTEIAGESSDLILTQPDLSLIPELISFSRKVKGTIRWNLAWALGYNLVAIPLAAWGLISPALAAALMASSSLLVVLNSLRLRSA